MQKLLNAIRSRCFVDNNLKERIEVDFESIEVKKGTKLLSQDNYSTYLYFIESGLLQSYYYYNGKEVSTWFYTEEQFATSWYSFYKQKQSFEELKCLEDSLLFRISFENYQKLIADFTAFNNFARLLAEESLAYIDFYSKDWLFIPAKEKYELFNTMFPGLEQRISLGKIASFIGISQETLSRIRSGK